MSVSLSSGLINANPIIYAVESRAHPRFARPASDVLTPYSAAEIFDLIRAINDPEHPMTLEQLHVTQEEHVYVDDTVGVVRVDFTPTIPHCSMATLIGLCIRVRLMRTLPRRFKIDIFVREGTHQSEMAVNKQLNDKERVAAAMENQHLIEVVNQCVARAEEESAREQSAAMSHLDEPDHAMG